MYPLYKNGFRVASIKELNEFVNKILELGEDYIAFMMMRNRIYLPMQIEPKDAAVDVLAELFTVEDGVLIKFADFFESHSLKDSIQVREKYDSVLRSFIYAIIQNRIQLVYKDNDKITCSLIRNINAALKHLEFSVTLHFSDKYISRRHDFNSECEIADRDNLINIISMNGIGKCVYDTRRFISELFDILEKQVEFADALRMSDLTAVMRHIIMSEYLNRDGAASLSAHISERLNVKYMLEEVKMVFREKLEKYIIKNNLSENFGVCMYNVAAEVSEAYYNGIQRRSVMELMKEYFQDDDTNLFYKVQYCLELYDREIIQLIEYDA